MPYGARKIDLTQQPITSLWSRVIQRTFKMILTKIV